VATRLVGATPDSLGWQSHRLNSMRPGPGARINELRDQGHRKNGPNESVNIYFVINAKKNKQLKRSIPLRK